MTNEVEVISQTCYAANRAYAAATGNPGLPEWGATSESLKNETRQRVTNELQRLRTGGTGFAGSENPPGRGTGGEGDDEAIQNGIIAGVVHGILDAQAQLRERRAA